MNKPVNITEEIKSNRVIIQDLVNKFILITNYSKVSYIFYVCSTTNILTLKYPSYRHHNYDFISLEYYVSVGFDMLIL